MTAPAMLPDILDVLYGVAANPDAWEELVDVLPLEAPQVIPAPEVEADLARSVRIAGRVTSRSAAEPASPLSARIELTRDLKVASVNQLARHSLEAAPLRTGERLRFPAESTQAAFGRAAAAAVESGQPALFVMSLPKQPGPSVGRLAPTADGFALTFMPPSGALNDLDRWFGLSPAESRLANALRHSGALAQAATTLGVSVNTARNQLAAIFNKLGIRRQGDLSRLLAELAAVDASLHGAPTSSEAPEPRTLTLADGRRLSYREYGLPDGLPVIIFHEGLGSSLLPPESHTLALRLGLRLIAADRPGFGRSDRLTPHSFAQVALDIEALCEALVLSQVVIAGLLSGATPALATAARMGQRVRRVLIVSGRPPSRPSSTPLTPLTAFRARLERHGWLRPTIFRMLKARVSPAAISRMLARAAQASRGDRAFLDERPNLSVLVSAYVTEALLGDGIGPSDELASSQEPPAFELAQIDAPLVILHGAEDQLAPLEDLRRYLGQHPYELKLFGDVGQFMAAKHWPEILECAAGSPPVIRA